MTAEPDEAPFWAEDPAALLRFACSARPDWSRDETWRAIHAAHNAGIPYDRLTKRLLAIAFRDKASSPLELRDEAAQRRPNGPTGADVYARGSALWRDLYENRKTGPLQVLTEPERDR